ncbi:MAG: hypothetical protein ACYC7E_07005 [Armatimonadota bacterium]
MLIQHVFQKEVTTLLKNPVLQFLAIYLGAVIGAVCFGLLAVILSEYTLVGVMILFLGFGTIQLLFVAFGSGIGSLLVARRLNVEGIPWFPFLWSFIVSTVFLPVYWQLGNQPYFPEGGLTPPPLTYALLYELSTILMASLLCSFAATTSFWFSRRWMKKGNTYIHLTQSVILVFFGTILGGLIFGSLLMPLGMVFLSPDGMFGGLAGVDRGFIIGYTCGVSITLWLINRRMNISGSYYASMVSFIIGIPSVFLWLYIEPYTRLLFLLPPPIAGVIAFYRSLKAQPVMLEREEQDKN